MGADNLAGFHRWQHWRDIAALVPIAVVDRPGAVLHPGDALTVPDGEIEEWARTNDPLDRYAARLTGDLGFAAADVEAIDGRVRREVDEATDIAEASPPPEALDALVGIYGDPPAERPLWFREGVDGAVARAERVADAWGVYKGDAKTESQVSQEDA